MSDVRLCLAPPGPIIRQISAFIVGTAAMNPDGLYAVFCKCECSLPFCYEPPGLIMTAIAACIDPLCDGLRVETNLEDEEEALAHDNFVSACKHAC